MSDSVSVVRFYTFTISNLIAVFCVAKRTSRRNLRQRRVSHAARGGYAYQGVTLHLHQRAVGQKRWGDSVPGNDRGTNPWARLVQVGYCCTSTVAGALRGVAEVTEVQKHY